ncbi:hypothetical protein [Paraburkholderia sediminicola]|uniref:hypothetical protein n=1 Tax=Paraburkholderia sediminicola TaxID=458836 RepID=UPI0038B9A802
MKILLIDIARDLADIASHDGPHSDSNLSSISQDALTSIRERASSLQARVNALLGLVDGACREALTGWTDSHRQLFGEWCRKIYPNEASAGTIALGETWMDGWSACWRERSSCRERPDNGRCDTRHDTD